MRRIRLSPSAVTTLVLLALGALLVWVQETNAQLHTLTGQVDLVPMGYWERLFDKYGLAGMIVGAICWVIVRRGPTYFDSLEEFVQHAKVISDAQAESLKTMADATKSMGSTLLELQKVNTGEVGFALRSEEIAAHHADQIQIIADHVGEKCGNECRPLTQKIKRVLTRE